ncbi:N-acetyl-gamma-glutamyl-phosphate reductase [Rhodohalobacter sulfatireducens]|jgi:N-acetyl-gamma-glutamyl-phosphate reductase|uniref:N-acetyl-gamma-glutamyl-phosphate reductase n=1 Tax=Rhodohalobacter sulfatireducens TaxID=2911366 RepID=A0ABS9KIC3_9BACT|nr:N-acetyl-gamma-glutamyl-phosphate reductase [Rhodohalobacter sulfatireducens]MCG2590580.1 N-acetyl-gamma-glutamyl-phosphate reductase [Rhodohalobacter sulfatireducens]
MAKHKVGIVGASGYTGSELVRLLTHHPDVTLEFVTSESYTGKKITDIHPHFQDLVDITLVSIDDVHEYEPDLVFLALPHGVSMNFVKEHGLDDFIIIDLSGDFRFSSQSVYEKWYKKDHVSAEYMEQSVYGLPELFRDKIRNAQLIANPGCYPTSAILALAPLIKQGYINPSSIVVDSKSGVTGAGAKPKEGLHFPDVFGNFSAYSLVNHRHTPEIEHTLLNYSGYTTEVLFTPHLLPIDRGILTTTYSTPKKEVNKEMVEELFHSVYEKEHFVRVFDSPPSLKNIRGSNYCDIHAAYDERTHKIITISTIDNLVKGAAGQAVQNMNIVFGLIESTGLKQIPLNP